MPTTVTASDVLASFAELSTHAAPSQALIHDVQISAQESAWNPASTKHVLYGPARLRYVQYADGGISCEVV